MTSRFSSSDPLLNPVEIDRIISAGLAEDVATGDVTSLATIPKHMTATGRFLVKASGVIAGIKIAERVFFKLDSTCVVKWSVSDGDFVPAGTYICTVTGPALALLTGERLALNLIQRMSGIATATRAMVEAVGNHHAKILDTRKTAPGLRLIDKYAVKCGGGVNHRVGLFDMVLVKDNHVTVAGGIAKAVLAVKDYFLRTNQLGRLQVEVETRTLEEVKEALAIDFLKIDRLLLDNMVTVKEDQIDTTVLQRAVTLVGGRIPTEASGNVTLATVPAIAATGVDFISSGSLTHSVVALDISLKIKLDAHRRPRL